jgi:hypothetical protein
MEAMRPFAVIDVLIVSALLCGAVLTFNKLGSIKPDIAVVFRQNAVIAEYPLDRDAVFAVNGKLGTLDIEIKGGATRIVHATCPRGVCVMAGAISGANGRIICAPNNILIQIRSKKVGDGVDAVAY